tara:strand:- start:65 stop:322 length:258 start_codon:yes stop_codon:yes gene_type:complete
MATENTPQVTNDEPVLVLDDKKYLIENLSDDAKMVVAALQSVGTQIQNNQLTGLQLQASQESLTAKLKELVADVESEDVPPVEGE